MGRFISPDAFVATGQGFVGNNMFAYCNNNPVMFEDSTGTRPILSTSLRNETEDDKKASFEYMRKSNSLNNKPLSAAEKAKEVGESLWNNLELSAGVGQGICGEYNLLDLVGVQIGMYGNYAFIKLEDGKFSFGQELNQGISASFFGHNFGATDYRFIENGVEKIRQENIGFYTDETWTIHSGAVYPLAGYSYRIGFDIVQFSHDMYNIFQK